MGIEPKPLNQQGIPGVSLLKLGGGQGGVVGLRGLPGDLVPGA